ncbi:kinase-like domain-containing protein [Radiomyces spectabilis]|uniref:kinase-like domain-containing protein n=1 Tax=Radiomyces spectabilis TaxID=64574 RepID=UPI0022212345|nr:kinase-like domain-containing protein [Radiomyces spectabilis]KAI8364654.1 kinase-like domain-containing protein [Radiomyces spectabilis]
MGATCCKQEEVDFTGEVELSHFYLLRVIGKGAFGKVRIVQHKQTLCEYALKYISKERAIELQATNNIIAERRLLQRIEYPLIVNLRYAFHDEANLFMVLDLMLGGDLRFHLDRQGALSELQVRFYVADIALALYYLHQRRIAHRDIKPDNILLDSKGHAHLSDFNVATQFDDARPLRWSCAGSLAYMAPEILAEKGYNTTVDWWSLGILAYELLFDKRPFTGTTSDELKQAILQNSFMFPENVEDQVSQACIDFISGLLVKSPFHRLGCGENGFEDLKNHPWFDGLDWRAMETKEAIPPFMPNPEEMNFDAVHELEELLLEEAPLRPRKRSVKPVIELSSPLTRDQKERQLMDDKFLPFDYTKDTLSPYTHTKIEAPRLFRRVGDVITNHYDQSRYRAQGYERTDNQEQVELIPCDMHDKQA